MSCTGKKLHRRCLSHCDFTHLSDISFTTHRIMSFDHCCNVITLCILSKSYSYLFPFLLLVLRCVSLPPGRLYVVDAQCTNTFVPFCGAQGNCLGPSSHLN